MGVEKPKNCATTQPETGVIGNDGVLSRRNQILARAAELIAERGYRGTTLMDIAIAANIAKATVFHYFTTKEQLLFELYSSALELALKRIGSIEKFDDPATELGLMLREHALLIMENKALFTIFFAEESSLDPEHQRSVMAQQIEYINSVAARVAALQRAGRVRVDVSPRVAAQSMLGMGSWTYRWFRTDGPLSATQVADYIADLAMHGLMH
jgi:TetR/AcrR family transcriptional regulator, cholesterol catabolism regulator